jgi:hypothetical protein
VGSKIKVRKPRKPGVQRQDASARSLFQGEINVLIIETYRVLILRTLSTTDNDGVTRDQTMALIVLPLRLVSGCGNKMVSISPHKKHILREKKTS